jgi:hypothetical protein
VPLYVGHGPNGYPSYQFTMARQERINGKWPDTPDRMLVKTTREPLRVYAKWLPGGAHAGQETIYDTTLRKDEMYGHLGGLLGKIPVDGARRRAGARPVESPGEGSRHRVHREPVPERSKEIPGGRRPAADPRRSENHRRRTRGRPHLRNADRPPAVLCEEGSARPRSARALFRTVESYDNDGRIFERIVIETIAPATLDASAFDPKNPDYAF